MQNLSAIFLAAFICGAGHLIKGYKKRGVIFLISFVLCVFVTVICSIFYGNPLFKVGSVGFGILSLWVWLYNLIDISTLRQAGVTETFSQQSETRYRQAMALFIQGN